MASTSVVPARRGERPSSTVRARVLGGFDVVVQNRPLTPADWQRTSATRLVKLLLVTPGHTLSRELAAETLWPGCRPDRGRTNLRKAIHFLRRALGPDAPLSATSGSVGLDAHRIDLDLDWLEAAIALISEHAIASSVGPAPGIPEVEWAAAEVIGLGGLDLLPDDPYEPWLDAPRERIRAGWERTALHAARTTFHAGQADAAHALIDRLLARDPADEGAHRLAVELYATEGRHQHLQAQIARCEAALREIDAEPSEETRTLFRQFREPARVDER